MPDGIASIPVHKAHQDTIACRDRFISCPSSHLLSGRIVQSGRDTTICRTGTNDNSTPVGLINAGTGTILHTSYGVNIISSVKMGMQDDYPAAGDHQEKEVIARDGA